MPNNFRFFLKCAATENRLGTTDLYIQRYDVKCQTHIYVFTENDNLQIRKAFVMIYEVQKDRNIINFFNPFTTKSFFFEKLGLFHLSPLQNRQTNKKKLILFLKILH